MTFYKREKIVPEKEPCKAALHIEKLKINDRRMDGEGVEFNLIDMAMKMNEIIDAVNIILKKV